MYKITGMVDNVVLESGELYDWDEAVALCNDWNNGWGDCEILDLELVIQDLDDHGCHVYPTLGYDGDVDGFTTDPDMIWRFSYNWL